MKGWFKSSPELSIEGLMIVRDVTHAGLQEEVMDLG